MVNGNEQALKGEQTLKHLLEFLSKLEESQLKTKVIEEIEKKVQGYIKDDDKYFGTLFLPKTISKSKELRRNILKEEKEREYRHFTQSFDDDKLDETDYAKHLIDNMFSLFGCLYYMYYECASDCSFIKGGEWKTEKCDGSGGDQGQYLNKWLKDETGKGVRPHDRSSILMIDRGFGGIPLSDNDGKTLFPKRKSALSGAPTAGNPHTNALLDYDDGAELQWALYYLLFLPKRWDRGQSGHAVLFLKAFCDKVTGGQFDDKYVEKDGGGDEQFKKACQGVSNKIGTFTGLRIIMPVNSSDIVEYGSLLEATHFWNYIQWLQGILDKLITSLAEMASDASKWNQGALKTSSTFGPFPWGFTFYDGSWNNKNKEELKQQLSGLNTALTSFSTAINDIKPIPSSSPASTVGSVIGGVGAAAATAGAAYAGSSVLGPVAEGVGKFFKGLLL